MSDGPTIQSTPTRGNAFAGDVTAQAAWDELGQNPGAILIDVRSDGEWTQQGVPDLSSVSKSTVLIELETQTGPNPNFVTQVMDAVPAKDDVVIFICRSGARSAAAATALAAQGFTQCYNLLGGADAGGWKAAELPWGPK
ncbi:MAG: rhodanese-like domain-containing protein [Alphaproteobacteria bacterium]|jgi:rhodanese-related sulfurtransferase|nr:rhodanese-like domain-containing protein [Alphaproteobacteria bacterium]MBT4710762.1 rhodanese-like domain-containing protein [Alphaproteobacteria bacterium]